MLRRYLARTFRCGVCEGPASTWRPRMGRAEPGADTRACCPHSGVWLHLGAFFGVQWQLHHLEEKREPVPEQRPNPCRQRNPFPLTQREKKSKMQIVQREAV